MKRRKVEERGREKCARKGRVSKSGKRQESKAAKQSAGKACRQERKGVRKEGAGERRRRQAQKVNEHEAHSHHVLPKCQHEAKEQARKGNVRGWRHVWSSVRERCRQPCYEKA